jgi:aminopeptidase N/puromycin-sensitive aminopeptidase
VKAQFTTEMGAVLVGSTSSFCSAEAREGVKSFFAAHPVSSSDKSLRHAIERIDGCVELRTLQEPNLKLWLSTQPKP